ncbi:flavin reductase (DIM6/NTAB) family NADH-FMN oxidoreductase RutF [Kineococcus xinjiangensis]|uniref:Flavin reductase (DIM6/NTAB) family NADH-FMN oxidoreductase RutF n=1 Tax=Kineococcus xinjiangensis TaxID=512762 RepID=A0A2S6IHR8_9ACTN|nr:flavin reductase family protein [Kineococcus xinjiangensis]PPK93757.1 flavin reductase (DIM6/NTAB) family NADH-FMN oxidoreductase RutF [Kineococcus xinjiangensis]
MTRRDYDPAALGRAVYPLLTSIIVPRPIAWVSTRSADGVDNVAPHSFFTVSSVDPPVVQFTSVGEKDSLRNARATGEFVVCLSDEENVERVNATATDYPADVSEFDAVGLTREASTVVRPPRVAESPVAIECRVLDLRSFGDSTVVFGQVVWVAVDEDVLREGRPAIDLLRPVARLGADEWSAIGPVSTRRRIPYELTGE